ncbi:GnsA/GnsB family addiction module toxin, partial [Escherichia coli]
CLEIQGASLVTSIQFTAREKMTGLESYDIKIDLI